MKYFSRVGDDKIYCETIKTFRNTKFFIFLIKKETLRISNETRQISPRASIRAAMFENFAGKSGLLCWALKMNEIFINQQKKDCGRQV